MHELFRREVLQVLGGALAAALPRATLLARSAAAAQPPAVLPPVPGHKLVISGGVTYGD